MACTETFATLRIFSADIAPKIISARLGLSPTSENERDEKSTYRPRRENHSWSWSTKDTNSSVQSQDHIQAIIVLLQPKKLELTELRNDGCKIDIFCFWTSTDQGGFDLSVSTMNSLVDLQLPIAWDIYSSSEHEA